MNKKKSTNRKIEWDVFLIFVDVKLSTIERIQDNKNAISKALALSDIEANNLMVGFSKDTAPFGELWCRSVSFKLNCTYRQADMFNKTLCMDNEMFLVVMMSKNRKYCIKGGICVEN